MTPSRPVIVSAASSALTIAASVASTRRRTADPGAASTTIVTGIVSGVAGADLLGRRHALAHGAEREDEIAARVLAGAAGAADAERAALRQPVHWCGSSGASVAHSTMIDPAPSGSPTAAARRSGPISRRPAARRRPGGRGRPWLACTSTPTVHAPASDDPRRGPQPALEAVADHPGAAADAALLDRPGRGARERLVHVLGAHVEAVDVVQHAVPGLAHHRQAPVRRRRRGRATSAATSASRTTPTLWVFVRPIGVVRQPDSRIHSSPVSSPLPLSRCSRRTAARGRRAARRP